jgi:hypothetical protein
VAEKKINLVMFGYDDGSYEIANGDHAREVMTFLSGCQTLAYAHGSQYQGRKMVEIPAPGGTESEAKSS